jgi:hypothetical protein
MDYACQFSFNDLYQAAFSRSLTEEEKSRLYGLSQNERNQKVGEWVRIAKWGSELRVGSDGVYYRAFWQPQIQKYQVKP